MKCLYHYTGVGGFEGIIKNNSIRMTKSNFLNDPADCHLFITLIEKYINSHRKIISDIILATGDLKNKVEELYNDKGCDLIGYIEYIHKHISLYVMSLTQIDDGLNMWNYYGQGGIELKFSMEELIQSLKETLTSKKEFLAEAHVIYANSESDIKKIRVPAFSEFSLINKESNNIFEDHRAIINEISSYEATQLYSMTDHDKFIYTYLRSYITTLSFLLEKGKISIETSPEIIFNVVFNNVSKLNHFLYWKHDLSLYMLVLSAFIKNDTYEYEDEYRIIYFEYNTDQEKVKKEEYTIKQISSGNFICPFITFTRADNDFLQKTLMGITVSSITRNLPISNDVYLETLRRFLLSNGFTDTDDVNYSKHNIRW